MKITGCIFLLLCLKSWISMGSIQVYTRHVYPVVNMFVFNFPLRSSKLAVCGQTAITSVILDIFEWFQFCWILDFSGFPSIYGSISSYTPVEAVYYLKLTIVLKLPVSSEVVPDVVPVDVPQLSDFVLQITVVMVGRICLLHGFLLWCFFVSERGIIH